MANVPHGILLAPLEQAVHDNVCLLDNRIFFEKTLSGNDSLLSMPILMGKARRAESPTTKGIHQSNVIIILRETIQSGLLTMPAYKDAWDVVLRNRAKRHIEIDTTFRVERCHTRHSIALEVAFRIG